MQMLQQSTEALPNRFGIRHLQVLLLFLGVTIGYTLRSGMSVAVVSMADASTANPNIESYGWTKKQKDLVLSSFHWGYMVMQVPSGYIADIWGGQKLLGIGMLLSGIIKILTPIVAHYGGLEAVLVCRTGMGFTQACVSPCTQNLLSKWVPPAERARLGTFVYAGGQLGIVITLSIAGALAASSIGWPSIFYLFGALAIIWSIAFFYFGADSPSKHGSISQKERNYIEESLRTTKVKNDEIMKKKVPWKEIFTSKPMWALIIVQTMDNWGIATLMLEIPSYITGVFNFNIKTTGVISTLPYLMMFSLSFPISWLSDFALKKGASRSTVRKISNSVGHWGPAVALACMSVVSTDNYVWAIVILVLTVGLNAGVLSGFQINHIDLSPNFAGTMMSITNCVANIASIIAPLMCAMIVTDETSVYQWNIVFYITSAFYFLGNLVFVIFGKGEIQWWDNPETQQQDKKEEEKRTKRICEI